METLEDKIKKFLTIDAGYGYGSDDAYDCDCDYDSGEGYGDGLGSGSGCNYGDGYGSGSGSSKGDSFGHGQGSGYGSGYSYSNGNGSGNSNDSGVKMIQGHTVYMIDNMQTIITLVRGNVAQGFILQSDLQLKPCYIAKENNKFAHGNTLRDAFTSLQEKLYDDSTEEERIEAFMQKFPSYDTKYDNQDLFTYHHVLTGSCRMGREQFAEDKGLSLDDKMSIREFVKLTKHAYGGEIIKQLPQAYGITD